MRRATLIAPILGLVLVACGGGAAAPTAQPVETNAPSTSEPVDPEPSAPVAGTALDACEIIAPADIAAATGIADVAEGELEVSPTVLSPGHTECTYQGDFGRIIVSLTPEDGANLYDAARGAYKDAVDITLGDGAFNSNGENRAFIWKGSVTTMLTMFLNGDLEQYDVAEQLGQAMIAKL